MNRVKPRHAVVLVDYRYYLAYELGGVQRHFMLYATPAISTKSVACMAMQLHDALGGWLVRRWRRGTSKPVDTWHQDKADACKAVDFYIANAVTRIAERGSPLECEYHTNLEGVWGSFYPYSPYCDATWNSGVPTRWDALQRGCKDIAYRLSDGGAK